jgi:hypothetical protein
MDEFLVYYDDQCEVCQAGVSWLRFLDRRHMVRPVALSSATLPAGLLLAFESPVRSPPLSYQKQSPSESSSLQLGQHAKHLGEQFYYR